MTLFDIFKKMKIKKLKTWWTPPKAWNNLYTYLAYLWISWGSLFSLNKKCNFHWQCQMKQAPACLWVSITSSHKEEIKCIPENNPNEASDRQDQCVHITLSHVARKTPPLAAGIRRPFPLQVTRRQKHGCAHCSMGFSISNIGKKANTREGNGTDLASTV